MSARYARLQLSDGVFYARAEGDSYELLSGAPWEDGVKDLGRRVKKDDAIYLPPSDASKVVAIGQNYAKHAAEMGKPIPVEPLIFMKPKTALNAHGAAILLPPASQEVHHEAELALVIGKKLTRVTEEEAAAAIFGVTCFNDVTARDVQKREIQHTRAKSYDTFACCGPELVTGIPFDDLRVVCRLNGAVKQDGRTSDMVHSPAKLVAFISNVMTLLPGDIVSTGTPSGVGPIVAGDIVEVEIENVGVLRNVVTR